MIRDVYSETLAMIRSNIGYFAGLTAIFLFLDWLDASVLVETLAVFVMTLQIYLHALFGKPLSLWIRPWGARFLTVAKFALMNALFVGAPLAVTVAAGFGIMRGNMFDYSGPLSVVLVDYFPEIMAAVFFGLYGIMLIGFGTALPATLAGERYAQGLDFSRSRATAASIAVGLLAGPGLVGAVNVGASFYLADPVGLDLDLTHLRALEPIEVALATVLDFASTLQTVLAIIVLCQAYRLVMPRPTDDRLAEVFS